MAAYGFTAGAIAFLIINAFLMLIGKFNFFVVVGFLFFLTQM